MTRFAVGLVRGWPLEKTLCCYRSGSRQCPGTGNRRGYENVHELQQQVHVKLI